MDHNFAWLFHITNLHLYVFLLLIEVLELQGLLVVTDS
jgi:hypothetical protein